MTVPGYPGPDEGRGVAARLVYDLSVATVSEEEFNELIAIMRDGVIDQMGTAEELITNPGSDYVAAFTKNVSRAKLLRVHTLMGPPSDDAQGDVDGRVFVASVANQIPSSAIPLRVDEDGEVVGSITAAQVIEALFGAE